MRFHRAPENGRQRFISLWLKRIAEKKFPYYDITFVSSNGKGNEYVKFGYNRGRDSLKQINLAIFFGQRSGLPACYRRMSGNISDLATLKTTVKSLDFLGAKKMSAVLNRGFYSIANIEELYLIFYTLKKITLLIINELSAPKILLAQHFDFSQDTSFKIFKKTL